MISRPSTPTLKGTAGLLTAVLITATLSLLSGCAGPPPEPKPLLQTGVLSFNAPADKGTLMSAEQYARIPGGITPELIDRYRRISAIEIPSGERRQYVFGDNIAGYWEGLTHSYRRSNGYQIAESMSLADMASAVNGSFLNRRIAAENAVLRPGEIEYDYAGGRETLLMLSGRQTMALELHSADGPSVLSFFPAFMASLSHYEYQIRDGVLLLMPSRLKDEYPAVIAISADVPVRFGDDLASSLGRVDDPMLLKSIGTAAGTDARSDASTVLSEEVLSDENLASAEKTVRSALKISDRSPLLTLSTEQPVDRAAFFVSFGYDADDALQQAKEARESGIARSRAVMLELGLRSRIEFPDENLEKALIWSEYSGYTMVTRQYGTGIWAGLPWFRQNWGRDSFIALPGILLTTDRFEEARDVLDTFAKFQNLNQDDINYGRVPNRVNNPDDIIYNTTDGTPWLLREALEYIQYSGDREFASRILDLAKHYIDGAVKNYVGEDYLLEHDDADTWMDARIAGNLPWSARGNRAVEIQALWYSSLKSAAAIAGLDGDSADAADWNALAEKVKASFNAEFWDGEQLADRLREDGSRDIKLRPNQLMAVSVPYLGDFSLGDFMPPEVQARATANAVNGLLYPYGIASLDPTHPYFHPHHDNTGLYHKDAAYHNGTIWGWNDGPALTAMLKLGAGELSGDLILNLADQINNLGTQGSMSELLDALPDSDGNIVPSGTFSQAWSVSEFTRVLYQDLIGFRPRLLEDRLMLSPLLPENILPRGESLSASLAFGSGQALDFSAVRADDGSTAYRMALAKTSGQDSSDLLILSFAVYDRDKGWRQEDFALTTGTEIIVKTDASGAPVSAGTWETVFPAFPEIRDSLKFRDPVEDAKRDYPAMDESNYLQKIIEAGQFE